MAYDTPTLLNRAIDRNHRSFLSAVEGAQLGTFRPRTSREWLRVDPRHVPWLRAAGLLPLCRLVEAAADDRDPAKRWDADRSLLAALVDRWRPETHTFHLPCGEMAPTLQDVSYLLGLPLAGAPVGPVDGVVGWKEDITAGIFGTGPSSSHAGRTGPTSQFYDDDLHGADHQDVLGSSQLGGAPEAHTQEQPEVTPVQAGRVGRAVPPDRLTYSQGHIRAQGRRDRGKRPRQ